LAGARQCQNTHQWGREGTSPVGIRVLNKNTSPDFFQLGSAPLGKQADFERRAADFYPTPPAALVLLIP
jgi:hypothetical protein